MQIKKISNDKLKVILSSSDLYEKNIDVDSFLSNSIESQDLFFEILDLAEEKFSFSIENQKAIVEAVSLDNHVFVLTITKMKNENKSCSSVQNKLYRFESLNDFLSIKSIFSKMNGITSATYFYEWNHQYFLMLTSSNCFLENFLLEYATPVGFPFAIDFLVEHGKKIREH